MAAEVMAAAVMAAAVMAAAVMAAAVMVEAAMVEAATPQAAMAAEATPQAAMAAEATPPEVTRAVSMPQGATLVAQATTGLALHAGGGYRGAVAVTSAGGGIHPGSFGRSGQFARNGNFAEGLLDKVVEFAERYKADYTPLNEFLKAVDTIAERESAALRLRRFEILPTITAFKATLERRRTTKVPWSEGWPMIKYSDRPKAANWGLHYYFNKAGVEAAHC